MTEKNHVDQQMDRDDTGGHHRLVDAATTLGEAFTGALMGIFPPHHRDHWEEVVDRYDREHPTGPAGRGKR